MPWDGGPLAEPPAVLSPYAAKLAGRAPTPAPARDVTAEECAALSATFDRYAAAVRDADGRAFLDTMPPEIVPLAAERNGRSVADFPAYIGGLMQQAKAAGATVSVDFDLSRVRVETLPDGTPYAVVPTHAVTTRPDGKSSGSIYNTLAFRQGQTWRLYPLNDDLQIATLKQELPAFGATDLHPTPSGMKP